MSSSGPDERHREQTWLPAFVCFVGSRVKTFIYFYEAHGLGDFFFLILKIKFLRKIQNFDFTDSNDIKFGLSLRQSWD